MSLTFFLFTVLGGTKHVQLGSVPAQILLRLHKVRNCKGTLNDGKNNHCAADETKHVFELCIHFGGTRELAISIKQLLIEYAQIRRVKKAGDSIPLHSSSLCLFPPFLRKLKKLCLACMGTMQSKETDASSAFSFLFFLRGYVFVFILLFVFCLFVLCHGKLCTVRNRGHSTRCQRFCHFKAPSMLQQRQRPQRSPGSIRQRARPGQGSPRCGAQSARLPWQTHHSRHSGPSGAPDRLPSILESPLEPKSRHVSWIPQAKDRRRQCGFRCCEPRLTVPQSLWRCPPIADICPRT